MVLAPEPRVVDPRRVRHRRVQPSSPGDTPGSRTSLTTTPSAGRSRRPDGSVVRGVSTSRAARATPSRPVTASVHGVSANQVLTLSCPDRTGIVHAVAGAVLAAGGNIAESHQYGDPGTGRFFMRVEVAPSGDAVTPVELGAALRLAFAPVAAGFGMDWQLHAGRPPHPHADPGESRRPLPARPALPVAQRHPAGRRPRGGGQPRRPAAGRRVLRRPVPPRAGDPGQQGRRGGAAARAREELDVELVVLARYMQVLSDDVCRSCRAASSTSTTRSCPASRARGPTTRRTTAASS